MAIELINTDNVSDTGALAIDNANSVATAVAGGTTYLFVTGAPDHGVSVFSVDADGTLTNVDNVTDAGDFELNAAISSASAVVGGATYQFVAGFGDDGVSVFAVTDDGQLVNIENVTDTGDLELLGVRSVATAAIGVATYLFVASFDDKGVSVFSVGADGTLTNVDNVTDDGSLLLNGARSVATAVVNGLTFLFVASFDDKGVSVFKVSPDGTLTNVDNVTDSGDLELKGAGSVTSAEISGKTYLFVAGIEDAGVSVFRVANDGTLTNVDNVTDSGNLKLGSPSSVTTQTVDAITYLIVASNSFDSGVSVFSVAANGTLTNVANISDTGKLKLKGAQAVTTTVIDDVPYLFVAGIDDDGVSVFSLGHNIIDEAAAAVQVAENGTDVTTIAKVDAADPVVFTITGGIDGGLFDVDATTGALSFLAATDFEAPGDADGDNVYEIEITADDGIISETKAISVTVTDVDEPLAITSD
ncbi:MAG: beta-propeller fold lactonase family protein, partial [bacterium]|nr:beta-propeller fold lactonase family protein [bacterium]